MKYLEKVFADQCLFLVLCNRLHPLGIYAFAIPKDNIHESDENVIDGLKDAVKKKIGAFAMPQAFLVRW